MIMISGSPNPLLRRGAVPSIMGHRHIGINFIPRMYVTAIKEAKLFYKRKHITVHICETVQHFDTLVILIR
jgi:hypothetical protein